MVVRSLAVGFTKKAYHMNDVTTISAIVIAISAGMLASFIARKISSNKKQQMLSKYTELRRQSLELQGAMSNYILAGDADLTKLEGDITCADFYRQLKSNHVYNLSDKYLAKVKNSNNLLFLNKAERNLQEQEVRLSNARKLVSFAIAL